MYSTYPQWAAGAGYHAGARGRHSGTIRHALPAPARPRPDAGGRGQVLRPPRGVRQGGRLLRLVVSQQCLSVTYNKLYLLNC